MVGLTSSTHSEQNLKPLLPLSLDLVGIHECPFDAQGYCSWWSVLRCFTWQFSTFPDNLLTEKRLSTSSSWVSLRPCEFENETKQFLFNWLQNWQTTKKRLFAFMFVACCVALNSIVQLRNCLWWMLALLHAILTLTWLASILLLILLAKSIFSCPVYCLRFLTVLSWEGQEGWAVSSSSSFVVIMVMTICDYTCCLQ